MPVTAPAGCGGSGGFLGVSTKGAAGCTVTVGGTEVGSAPFFKNAVPTGSCKLKVACADGKSFAKTVVLRRGGWLKLVIEESDWK